jgi:hypothetical protein
MAEVLSYAPMPPPDRVHVVWQGNDLDITVPSRPTVRGITTITALVAITLLLWLLAIRGSVGVPGGGAMRLAGGLAGRASALIFGVVTFGWALMLLRQCRTWTRIALCGSSLTFKAPSLRGMRVWRVRFDTITDVSVGRVTSKRDKGTYLLLHRHSGAREPALENLTHRVGDLAIVAAALREALARRRPTAPTTLAH